MKKTMIIAIATAMVSGIATADLAVDWKSTGAALYDVGGSGGAGPFIAEAKMQLVWSATGITTEANTAYNIAGGATLAGEFVLDDQLTGVAAAFGTWSNLGGIYGNDAVGGAEINEGIFFARIFQDTAAAGEFFIDVAMGDAANYVYDAATPTTVYASDTIASTSNIDQNGS